MSVWQKTLEKMLQSLTLGEIKVTFQMAHLNYLKDQEKDQPLTFAF